MHKLKEQTSNASSASISMDLDNKWAYMKTHGDRGWEELPTYLDSFVPLVLSILNGLNLKITGQSVFIKCNELLVDGGNLDL